MIYNIYLMITVLRGPDILAVAEKVSILKSEVSNNAEDSNWS